MQTVTENKTGAEMAAEYAVGIVGELETLATLTDNWDTIEAFVAARDGYDPDDMDTAAEYEDAVTEAENACGGEDALADVLRLRRELGGDDAGEVVTAWVDGVLDVEVNGTHNGNGWEVTEVAFLVAFGGPTARVVWDGSSTLAVRCSWWSEEIVRRVECDVLATCAEGIAESVES